MDESKWRWMSDRQRWRVGSGVFVLILAGVSFWLYATDGGLIPLPETRDSLLVGTWKSDRKFDGEKLSRACTFRGDGTGELFQSDRLICPFRWGTESGVLYLKYQISNVVGLHASYLLKDDDAELTLDGKSLGIFPPSPLRRSAKNGR